MSVSVTPKNEEELIQAIISHFLNLGAKAEADARWICGILPADLLEFFRAEVLAAIRQKAGSAGKARKLFLSLGKTSRQIFGLEYARMKNDLDKESKAAVQKAEKE